MLNQTKYETFCLILPAVLPLCARDISIIATGLATILANGPGFVSPNSGLASSMAAHEDTVNKMIVDYCLFVAGNGPKPEWLTHAGL